MEYPPTLLALPDDVLAHVLSCLSLQERRRTAPLVCRQLRQLADSPSLNAAASVAFDGALCLPRLRSFGKWLARHSGSVRELRLEVDAEELSASDKDRACSVLELALASCGFAGRLQQLQLTTRGHQFKCSAWAARLRSLRALALDSADDGGQFVAYVVEESLKRLTQLQDLWLGSSHDSFAIEEEAALPRSLARLYIGCDDSQSMPPQISKLSRLQALGLHYTNYGHDSYASLAALPAVRRLSLEAFAPVPACLSQLTRLEALSIWDSAELLGDETAMLLQAALPHLSCLTHLAISAGAGQAAAALALASLPRLQHLVWEGEGEEEQSLPPGPYLRSLRSLRRLDTSPLVLLGSLPALAGATALECVGLSCSTSSPQQLAAAALRCADRLPAAQELQLDVNSTRPAVQAIVSCLSLNVAPRWARMRVSPVEYLFDPSRLRQLCLGPSPFSP